MDTNSWIRYYWDSSDSVLKRVASDSGVTIIVAHSVTNSVVFQAEDHLGNVLTDPQNNRVVSLYLDFYHMVDPDINLGTNGLFDFYRLRTKVTRRTLE